MTPAGEVRVHKNNGYTIIPIAIIVNDPGYIKFKIALCKGKHEYDKRETIKERELKREQEKLHKYNYK